jgi:tetratricopeptide (TPR) repeat protein
MNDNKTTLLESKKRYLSFHETDPGNVKIIEQLAEICVLLGEKAEAERLYGNLLKVDSENPNYNFALSSLYISQAQYQKAEILLEQLLKNGHHAQGIYYNLAYVKLETHQYDEAIYLLENQLQLEELPESVALLARAYHHTNDLEKAIELGTLAVLNTPDDPYKIGSLALSYFDYGNYEKATYWAQKALSLDKNNHQAMIIVSAIAIEEQRFDEAQEHLEKTVEHYPNSGRGWFSLGLSCMAMQQLDLAIEYINKSLELMPRFLGGYNTLAWAYIAKQDLDAAEKSLHIANSIDGNLGDTYGGLAVVYALKGQVEECKQNVLIARRLDKSSFPAAFAQVLLESIDGNTGKANQIMQNIFNTQVPIGIQQKPTSIFEIAKNSLDIIEKDNS